MEQNMQYILGGRNSGKTTRCLEWLMAGRPTDGYPAWSRVVVCLKNTEVYRLTAQLHRMTAHLPDEPWVWDLRKAVWGMSDLEANQGREFEMVVDNADWLFAQGLYYRNPQLVTLSGVLYGESPEIKSPRT